MKPQGISGDHLVLSLHLCRGVMPSETPVCAEKGFLYNCNSAVTWSKSLGTEFTYHHRTALGDLFRASLLCQKLWGRLHLSLVCLIPDHKICVILHQKNGTQEHNVAEIGNKRKEKEGSESSFEQMKTITVSRWGNLPIHLLIFLWNSSG